MSEELEECLRFYDEKVLTLSDIVSVTASVRERDDTRLFVLTVCDGFVQAYIRLFGLSYQNGSELVWQRLTWGTDDSFTLEVHSNCR
jgi:hypothetical protein